MAHKYRVKTAWVSYLGIQVFWVLCVLVAPFAIAHYPSRFWALPFCAVTVAGGLHLSFFYHEYNALMRRAGRLFPYARYLTPAQRDPRHFQIFGLVYTLFGVASALLVFLV
jgi:hypothetical protein